MVKFLKLPYFSNDTTQAKQLDLEKRRRFDELAQVEVSDDEV